MTSMNYRFFVRGQWAGRPDEKPAVIGAKFLRTLDTLSTIDPLFSGWQIIRNWEIAEDSGPRTLSLAAARTCIEEIVEAGVVRNDFDEPDPGYGYHVCASAGARGPRRVAFSARTGMQSFELSFGEYDLPSDLAIVKYPLFKAALLTISAAWNTKWSCAQAFRNDVVKVPIDFGAGVPAFRMDSAIQVPLDPTFPKSVFHIPWIVYLSTEFSAGVTLPAEILTEVMPDGGLFAAATTDRFDPTDPEDLRRARILVEILIDRTGLSSQHN